MPGDLLDTDLVNTIMNEDDDITKSEDNLEDIGGKVSSYFLSDRVLQNSFNIVLMLKWKLAVYNLSDK